MTSASVKIDPMQTAFNAVDVTWLGQLDYQAAWDLQSRLAAQIAAGQRPPSLLLLEHPHTFTIGRRGGLDHLLWDLNQRTQDRLFAPFFRKELAWALARAGRKADAERELEACLAQPGWITREAIALDPRWRPTRLGAPR